MKGKIKLAHVSGIKTYEPRFRPILYKFVITYRPRIMILQQVRIYNIKKGKCPKIVFF